MNTLNQRAERVAELAKRKTDKALRAASWKMAALIAEQQRELELCRKVCEAQERWILKTKRAEFAEFVEKYSKEEPDNAG